MKKWEIFELECTEYLKKTYPNITFEHIGSSNSNYSDIKVNDKDNEYFIEVKKSPAQCCQFVLFPEDKKFEYSSENKNPLNDFSKNIIEYMDNHFDYYTENNKVKKIEYENCEKDFFGCIKEFYLNKNVKYFMTNNFLLIPFNDIDKVFNVSASYRIKKSGSKKPNKSMIDELKKYINENYKINYIEYDGEHLKINSDEKLNKQSFELNNYKFIFSERDDFYYIRQLSKTNNPNVIFKVELKDKNIKSLTKLSN